MTMTLAEIRNQYPQYNNLSDQDLSDKLYEKHYSDKLNKEDFYSRIGFNPKQQSQPANEGFINKASNAVEKYWNNPIYSAVHPLAETVGGLGEGVANFPIGLYDLAASGLNKLPGVNLPKAKTFDVYGNSLPGKLGHLLSAFVAPSAVGKAGEYALGSNAAQRTAEMFPQIAGGLKNAVNVLKSGPELGGVGAYDIGKNALIGGAMTPENPLVGMTLGGASPYVSKGLSKAYETLRPSNLFRGNLSPEELQRNLELTRGTETGLGDVLESPFLKKQYENVLTKIPFSGALGKMQGVSQQLTNRGQDIMTNLLGKNNPENYESNINDALQKVHKEHLQYKNDLYDEADDIAEDTGLKLELPTFAKTAEKFRSAIENTNILKFEPDMASLMSKLGNYTTPVKEKVIGGKIVTHEGKPFTEPQYPSLKEANLLKGKLNELAEKYGASPQISERHAAGVFRQLASSLKTDINQGIKAHGNKELSNAYNAAEENYAKNFSQFLDKDIYKYAIGKADPDLILQHFIKTGKQTDRSNLLGKLIGKLPKEKRNLVAYGYLKRAIDQNGKIDPLAMRQLLSKKNLGERQMKVLFSDEKLRKELMDYADLVGKNTEAFNLMKNPPTGQRLTDYFPIKSAAAGAAGGYGVAGIPGAIGGMLGGGVGYPMASKHIVNALTSPETRENLIKKMIENSNKAQTK